MLVICAVLFICGQDSASAERVTAVDKKVGSQYFYPKDNERLADMINGVVLNGYTAADGNHYDGMLAMVKAAACDGAKDNLLNMATPTCPVTFRGCLYHDENTAGANFCQTWLSGARSSYHDGDSDPSDDAALRTGDIDQAAHPVEPGQDPTPGGVDMVSDEAIYLDICDNMEGGLDDLNGKDPAVTFNCPGGETLESIRTKIAQLSSKLFVVAAECVAEVTAFGDKNCHAPGESLAPGTRETLGGRR